MLTIASVICLKKLLFEAKNSLNGFGVYWFNGCPKYAWAKQSKLVIDKSRPSVNN